MRADIPRGEVPSDETAISRRQGKVRRGGIGRGGEPPQRHVEEGGGAVQQGADGGGEVHRGVHQVDGGP